MSSSANEGRAARARSTNNRAASLALTSAVVAASRAIPSARSGHTCSPAIASPSRLVARSCTPGQSPRSPSASSPAARSRCSQLSRTTRICFARRYSRMLPSNVRPCRGATPSVEATTCTNDSASRAVASSHSHAPSTNRGATSAATCIASRVLPTPPTPVTVTRRVSRSAATSEATSSSRPTNEVSCTDRFPGTASSVRKGGNVVSRPGASS